MGGAVKAVTQPVGKALGIARQTPGGQAVQQIVEQSKPEERRATRGEEEMGARMRGARRRGRQLLSDARLSAETGVETLGGGSNL